MSLEQRIQARLGDTHVLQLELGGGGMSRVFVAEETALKRKVVIKVLNPTLAATVSVERFEREIMTVARLNHANIVPVLSAGDVEGLPYFIMPYVDGESLRGRILRGPLSIREVVGVLKDVMRALAYAHAAGVVHRDIKPDNILFSGSAATVTDFGVAKAVSASRNRGELSAGKPITGMGISLGTPQYMAPEQVAADPNADHRVDLYAFGLVAYEMLVGSPPFFGRTPQALMAAQLTELPPPLASRRYDVPAALAELVMQCLEKDPADRPRSAADVARALDGADMLSGPVAALPRMRSRRLRRKVMEWGGAGIGATALIALTVWALAPTDRTSATDAPPGAVASAPGRVRLAAPTTIGEGSAAIASAVSSAIEAALVRAGVVVLGGASTDTSAIVLEQSLQRAGRRARLHIRMTSPSSDAVVWADQLDFHVDSSFTAQDSVAARVVRAVRRSQGQ